MAERLRHDRPGVGAVGSIHDQGGPPYSPVKGVATMSVPGVSVMFYKSSHPPWISPGLYPDYGNIAVRERDVLYIKVKRVILAQVPLSPSRHSGDKLYPCGNQPLRIFVL